MSQRVPCATCSATILPTTAAKTSGLCMPCATGIRQQIEEGKRYHERHKAFTRSPEWALWTSLVDRVHKTELGFAGLTHDEKLYYAVNSLNGEIYNGGFQQYFWNHDGGQYPYALEGLRRIGAVHALQALQQAKTAVFAGDDVPVDVAARRERLARVDRDAIDPELDRLDRAYCEDRNDLEAHLAELLRPLLPADPSG